MARFLPSLWPRVGGAGGAWTVLPLPLSHRFRKGEGVHPVGIAGRGRAGREPVLISPPHHVAPCLGASRDGEQALQGQLHWREGCQRRELLQLSGAVRAPSKAERLTWTRLPRKLGFISWSWERPFASSWKVDPQADAAASLGELWSGNP